jgi:signal transduction histidine kinase
VADFLSSLVHEFRTPLTALRGSLSLLTSEAEGTAPTVVELAEIAARNASRLIFLLDDLATYARLRRPDCVAAFTALDLSILLEQAAERVQPVAEERRVTVEVQLAPFDAVADEAILRDAVARMIFYAVRVTPRDGTVRVSAETVGDRVVIRVSDQGRALAESDRAELFEPFSPVARRGVDSADRAGLDLAIAKIAAERHDGFVEYRQVTGGGVVRLTLGAPRNHSESLRE